MTRHHRIVLAAAALAALAFVGPLYFPLIALGPLLGGLAAGRAGVGPRPAAATWLLAGLLVLVIDLAATGEDAAFHAAVALVTALVAAGAAALGLRLRRGAEAQPA